LSKIIKQSAVFIMLIHAPHLQVASEDSDREESDSENEVLQRRESPRKKTKAGLVHDSSRSRGGGGGGSAGAGFNNTSNSKRITASAGAKASQPRR
jgi:hypothetical protein